MFEERNEYIFLGDLMALKRAVGNRWAIAMQPPL